MRVTLCAIVFIIGGTTALSADDSEFSDCASCDIAVSNMRDALRAGDYMRVNRLLSCMRRGPAGIAECAEELFLITAEMKDVCIKLIVDSALFFVPAIAQSKYGCEVAQNAYRSFVYPENCRHIAASDTELLSRIVLKTLFSMLNRGKRAIVAYRIIGCNTTEDIRDDEIIELGEYSQELTKSEIHHICTLFEKDSRFVSNAACEPIRKRFSELKQQNYCPQSREDVLGLLREEIRAVVAQFSEKYGDKDVEPFKGLPQSEVTFGL